MVDQLFGYAALEQLFEQGMFPGHYRNNVDVVGIYVFKYAGFYVLSLDHVIRVGNSSQVLF